MKTTAIKTLLGTVTIASAMFLLPVATFAESSSSSVRINQSGDIHLSGVEVTSISGNIITSVMKFLNASTTVIVTTNASTSVEASPFTKNESLANIKVGDILNISGFFTGFSNTLTLTAKKIHDVTALASFRSKSGIVQSVNVSGNSFVIKTSNNTLVTIQNNASTTFFLGKKATSTLMTAITVNAKVEVRGLVNSDGTILTASKVTVKNLGKGYDKKDEKDEKNEKDHKSDKSNFGYFNRSDKKDR